MNEGSYPCRVWSECDFSHRAAARDGTMMMNRVSRSRLFTASFWLCLVKGVKDGYYGETEV